MMQIKNNLKDQRGFTIVELITVLFIIGILATLTLASLSYARKIARDTRRVSDLSAVATALEQYKKDKGFYPIAPIGACDYPYSKGCYEELVEEELSGYINANFQDPKGNEGDGQFGYRYGGGDPEAIALGADPNLALATALETKGKANIPSFQGCDIPDLSTPDPNDVILACQEAGKPEYRISLIAFPYNQCVDPTPGNCPAMLLDSTVSYYWP